MTIGERIKMKRLELGYTQEELARKCGYKSRSSINKIELARDLPLNKVAAMASILGCSPTELMGWEENRNVKAAYLFEDEQIQIINLYTNASEMEKDLVKRILGYTKKDA